MVLNAQGQQFQRSHVEQVMMIRIGGAARGVGMLICRDGDSDETGLNDPGQTKRQEAERDVIDLQCAEVS
jgi:hypothetical protein